MRGWAFRKSMRDVRFPVIEFCPKVPIAGSVDTDNLELNKDELIDAF